MSPTNPELADVLARLSRIEMEVQHLRNSQTIYLGDHEALTRLHTGHRIYVDTRDVGICSHLMLEGRWEGWVEAALREIVKPGMTFVDGGANFGYYTLLSAQWVGPGGKVISFEANPHIFGKLRRSVAVNGFDGIVELHNRALYSHAAELPFTFLPSFSGGGAIGTAPNDPAFEQITVAAVSLDDALRHVAAVDCLKLDVEGAEAEVISGARGIISRSPNLIIVLEFLASGRYPGGPSAFLGGFVEDGFVLRALLPTGVTQPLGVDEYLAQLGNGLGYLSLQRGSLGLV